jgi:hypothetical protein
MLTQGLKRLIEQGLAQIAMVIKRFFGGSRLH